MTSNHHKLNTEAELIWKDGQPYSSHYDDVYFSSDNGMAETDYVFLTGNDLSTRWQRGISNNPFTIVETGFGTGLNFCCTWRLFERSSNHNTQLHYISIEKHPLTAAALAKALSKWTELNHLADSLSTHYAMIDLGHSHQPITLSLAPNVKLTLLFGDVHQCLPQISCVADAFFLDGFAPAKNPDMWTSVLFSEMARLSKAGTTFATFTSAGNVRRGLKEAGFEVEKRSGFGKKREMLTGHWPSDQ